MWDEKECFESIDRCVAHRIAARFDQITPAQELVLMTLFALFRQGHLVLDASLKGQERLCDALSISSPQEFLSRLREGLQSFPQDREGLSWVVQEGELWYLQKNAQIESSIVEHLQRLQLATPMLELSAYTPDTRLNDEQSLAVEKGISSLLFFLTGGPGTGKTFTASFLIKACVEAAGPLEEFSVIVAAPTGKAAFHLGSSLRLQLPSHVSLRVGTIHHLLGKRRDEEEELNVVCADLILVDESSMIDAPLFESFLSAIPSGCRVVFIGDKNQLPPVESGSIFADLVDSALLPSVELITSVRTDSKALLSIASRIIKGEEEGLIETLQQESAWIDLERCDEEPLFDRLWQEYGDRFTLFLSEQELHALPLEQCLALGKGHFAILSCIRKGELGIEAINQQCYQRVMQSAPFDAWVLIPILITANHHDCDLYNSDQGVLLIKKGGSPSCLDNTVLFPSHEGGVRTIPLGSLRSFSFNYALSVHKSQGSEYEEVLILAPPGSEVFGREVLYTAVTRAKRKMVIASTQDLLLKTVRRTSRRWSGLQARLLNQARHSML